MIGKKPWADDLDPDVVQFGAEGLLKLRKGTAADGHTDHYVFEAGR